MELKNKYITNVSIWYDNIIIHFKKWYKKDAQCRLLAKSKTINWLHIIIWVKSFDK